MARQISHENLTKPYIQRALADLTMDEIYATKGLVAVPGSRMMMGVRV